MCFDASRKKATERCSSLVYRCLKAGGWFPNHKKELFCEDSEHLIPYLIASKEEELKDYPETSDWVIEGVEETKKFLNAKRMLMKVCDDYLLHNQKELDSLHAESPYGPPHNFFNTVLDKSSPDAGFSDWICCEYYSLLKSILTPFDVMDNPYTYYSKSHFDYPFEEMKWWKQNGRYEEQIDPAAPQTVLHNLKALLNVLNFHMERTLPELIQKKIELNYQEQDLTAISEAPLSFQIYKTLEHLKLRARLAESLMEKNNKTSSRYFALHPFRKIY